jgi:hypothetical protein
MATTAHSKLRFQPMSSSPIKAFAQPLVGVVRVGPGTDAYGKPWEYVVTYCSIGESACVVMALKGDGGFSMAHTRAIKAELRRIGFQEIIWDRKKPAGNRQFVIPAP